MQQSKPVPPCRHCGGATGRVIKATSVGSCCTWRVCWWTAATTVSPHTSTAVSRQTTTQEPFVQRRKKKNVPRTLTWWQVAYCQPALSETKQRPVARLNADQHDRRAASQHKQGASRSTPPASACQPTLHTIPSSMHEPHQTPSCTKPPAGNTNKKLVRKAVPLPAPRVAFL